MSKAQLHKLTCIDGLHSKGVHAYLVNEGWGSALCGREVYTDCQDYQVLHTGVANGMALLEEPSHADVLFYAQFRD